MTTMRWSRNTAHGQPSRTVLLVLLLLICLAASLVIAEAVPPQAAEGGRGGATAQAQAHGWLAYHPIIAQAQGASGAQSGTAPQKQGEVAGAGGDTTSTAAGGNNNNKGTDAATTNTTTTTTTTTATTPIITTDSRGATNTRTNGSDDEEGDGGGGKDQGGYEYTMRCWRVGSDLESVECDDGQTYYWKPKLYKPSQMMFWCVCVVSLILTLFAGAMSGLSLALLAVDQVSLHIVAACGLPDRQVLANKVLGIVKRHHVLLVTLLLSNAFAMEALPLCLEKIMPESVTIVISVTLVLFFGEIIPQALCSRWGLYIGAHSSMLVRPLMFIWAPVSYPLAWLLDHIVGINHGTYYTRPELKELLRIHSESNSSNHVIDRPLTTEQVESMCKVLDSLPPFDSVP
ncbi:Protein MAM3 [Pelomyxa schiedti]|nr:Protein MAM3 [Pelomyxa schiedti]